MKSFFGLAAINMIPGERRGKTEFLGEFIGFKVVVFEGLLPVIKVEMLRPTIKSRSEAISRKDYLTWQRLDEPCVDYLTHATISPADYPLQI